MFWTGQAFLQAYQSFGSIDILVNNAGTRATAARLGIDFDDLVKNWIAEIPVRRSGKPEDIANAAERINKRLYSREIGAFYIGIIFAFK